MKPVMVLSLNVTKSLFAIRLNIINGLFEVECKELESQN